uniref:VLIG-type G domain-containing protein n=1 Tax=Monopterus albus TaxID=43700 RepID=A0A3Q3JQ30_MONAL
HIQFESLEKIPWCFLRKLLKINAECRNCTQLSIYEEEEKEEEENNDLFDLDLYTADGWATDNKVNPLDVIVALFLCADSFLRQEMALKMSMCQFAVPLLLPYGNKSQCTLMLWALRDIVKEWRPHDLSESRGFVEKSIVQANMPLYSFVRLKNCSLSKSQCLNHVLNLGQNFHNIFTHRDMKGGAVTKTLATGLVEICWYLPSGTENLDIFPEPVAFTNLRGEICESLAQFKFLFEVSTATYVFLDKVEENEHKILTSLQDVKSKLFLVVNRKEGNDREDMMSVKTMLEMEECRMKKCSDHGLEQYKSQLQAEKEKIRNEQRKHKVSRDMESFIEHLSGGDKERRNFFLKWMKLKLNAHLESAIQLFLMRNKLKEQCNKNEKDVKLIAELDQALLDSSLGIEHYMREMALIYEFSIRSSTKTAGEISCLPAIAAEMLLDGYPFELLDGDASNIPERWVTAVLMELHKKVGGKSRLLVLTVLGVQSTGKSTLLNTMFGVQFPVSSGRCTRGAYMLLLKVGEDMQSDMDCDFIVLIDTEGLKSPRLAQLEDSYEHDNQLATFVIGLSEVTIINVSMENSTEMKDILQIATHAFLRMKEIGKKPVCHIVHQNVAAVSAHAKNITERTQLLDQLNEMTQIAAEMEKQPHIKAFTDVLDYDIDKNNWNIPGLWHGTPPMAAVNTGYSEAVANFKNNFLEKVKGDRRNEYSQIPEFLKWMSSLWKAVKFENFIFSFRNTLVANAYDNLCKEFNQWGWEFKRAILKYQDAAVLEINNTDNESELQHLSDLVKLKKSEVSKEIEAQQTLMKNKLQDYYKRRNIHVHLIEKYKTEFFNSIISSANEIQHSVNKNLDCVFELRRSSKEAQEIHRKHRQMIEEQVMKLLHDCKGSTLSDEELKDEFEKMWTKTTENVMSLKEQNISENIIKQYLQEIGKCAFEARTEHIKHNHNIKFEIDLKLHICGIASREFLKMHKKFLSDNDPKTQLEKYKTQYLSDFLDLYRQRDHCQRKATEFVQSCIKPAVEEYINRSLGVDIVDEILTSGHSAHYSSRSFFQYNIQKELLQQEDFNSFVKYIGKYEIYVKDWIFHHIVQKMSENKTLYNLKNKSLQVIVHKITEALEQASKGEDGILLPDNTESINELMKNMRKYLLKDISISVEAEKSTLFQIQSTCHPFTNSLKISIDGLEKQLQEEFPTSEKIMKTLNKLPVKPQDELFKRIFGCGQQCPFCKVPCEAGGKEHRQHHAAVHRPQGLGEYRNIDTQELVEVLCTTDVYGQQTFRNTDTKWEPHPYKDYTTYYPNWRIPPDPTIEASDYWKYVLNKYNDRFAQEYKAKPAVVPEAWKRITKEQALKGLKDAFNMK